MVVPLWFMKAPVSRLIRLGNISSNIEQAANIWHYVMFIGFLEQLALALQCSLQNSLVGVCFCPFVLQFLHCFPNARIDKCRVMVWDFSLTAFTNPKVTSVAEKNGPALFGSV